MWVKYKLKWSYSIDKNWTWEYLGEVTRKDAKELAHDLLSDVADKWNYSEHWRGIDWKLSAKAPKEVIQSKLETAKRIALSWQAKENAFENMLKPQADE